MPKLIPDPSAKIQTAPAPGPWILWERPRASARQEGLLCVLRACDNPNCPSVDVSLSVYPIDTGLDSVEWTDKSLKMLWRAPSLPEHSRAVHCEIDVFRDEIHCEERTDYAREIVERLRRIATPELLDRFHDIICRARRLPTGPATELPDDWEIGDHISYADAFQTARFDLIEEAGRTWVALDGHCPCPDCTCADTSIEVLQLVQNPRGLRNSLGFIIVEPDGKWDLKPDAPDGVVLREVWRRLQERWGDVPRELERRREIVRRVFGPMVRDAEEGGSTTPKPASFPAGEQRGTTTPRPTSTSPIDATARVSKTGRNDPCPCGSGRKYKRCCGSLTQ